MSLFGRVLVANRGEIAVRLCRTLRRLGIVSVAVHTPADAGALHVEVADEVIALDDGGYLDAAAIVEAARRAGADAVHPGYGFLAESPRLAGACATAGIVFVGPPQDVIALMGDKIAARAAATAAGLPVLAGVSGPGRSDEQLIAAAAAVGFPLLVKPAAGGGGKGMRVVHHPVALPGELAAARSEARAAFADDSLLLERLVERARHLEVQLLADRHGAVVSLGLRECSLQRRHQKVIEESPPASPIPAEVGAAMERSAVALARACGYVGAGTVEMIVPVDDPSSWCFLEMNTRLQVEHAVTEAVSGIDLVEWQLRVAAGEPLARPVAPDPPGGHAVEARLYAEDPARGFLPTGGRVLALRLPAGEGIRVDAGIAAGSSVPRDYDPLLAKIIAHGATRPDALERLRQALARTSVLGMTTNLSLLADLLEDPDVRAGRLDTARIERRPPAPSTPAGGRGGASPADLLAATALALVAADGAHGRDPWDLADGWRVGASSWRAVRLRLAEEALEVRLRGLPGDCELVVGREPPERASARWRSGGVDPAVGPSAAGSCSVAGPAPAVSPGSPGALAVSPAVRPAGELEVVLGGIGRRYDVAGAEGRVWLSFAGRAAAVQLEPLAGGGAAAAPGGEVRSPMPGVVTSIAVPADERVAAGQVLAVVEAMKMQHEVLAPAAGLLACWRAEAGDRVELDEVLAVVVPAPEGDSPVPEGDLPVPEGDLPAPEEGSDQG